MSVHRGRVWCSRGAAVGGRAEATEWPLPVPHLAMEGRRVDPLVTLARRSCDECKGAAISKESTTGGIAKAEMRPCK